MRWDKLIQFSSFCCPLLSDFTKRYFSLYFPNSLHHLRFLPEDIHLHHSRTFLHPALWRHATLLPSISVLKCKSTQQSPTTKRLVVTSSFRGWCSIVSLLKSCHCGKTFSIMPFACQDWASHIKISQITYFSCVFPGKKTLAHGESKAKIWPIDSSDLSQGLIFM